MISEFRYGSIGGGDSRMSRDSIYSSDEGAADGRSDDGVSNLHQQQQGSNDGRHVMVNYRRDIEEGGGAAAGVGGWERERDEQVRREGGIF